MEERNQAAASEQSPSLPIALLLRRQLLHCTLLWISRRARYPGFLRPLEPSPLAAQAYPAKRYRLQDVYRLSGGKGLTERYPFVHDFADGTLDRTLYQGADDSEERDSRDRFLDAVSKRTPDRKALRHRMINILVARRDTTACLLSWILSVGSSSKPPFSCFPAHYVTGRLLVKHPHILRKLRDESSKIVGNASDFDTDDLQKVECLTMVLKESG